MNVSWSTIVRRWSIKIICSLTFYSRGKRTDIKEKWRTAPSRRHWESRDHKMKIELFSAWLEVWEAGLLRRFFATLYSNLRQWTETDTNQ